MRNTAPSGKNGERRGIGATATANAMRKLRLLLKDAALPIDGVRPALIDHNPCERVPMPRFPKSKQAQIPAASPQELRTIYEAMPEYSRIAVYISALCGLRISEVCALQVRDIDLDATDDDGNPAPVLYVRHGLRRGEGDKGSFHLGPTKNEASHRSVPIASQRFVDMLRKQISQFTDGKPDSMLIPATLGKILSPNTLRSQFDAARKQTGRSLKGIPELHTHTLRATHDNRFSINSPNEKVALMGTRRAKSDVLIDRYQRANAHEIREAQQKTNDTLLPPDTPEAILAEIQRKRAQIQRLTHEVKDLEALLAEKTQSV